MNRPHFEYTYIKDSKTKSKSRTRRGGMTDSEIRKIKDQIKRLALSDDHETIDCVKYVIVIVIVIISICF